MVRKISRLKVWIEHEIFQDLEGNILWIDLFTIISSNVAIPRNFVRVKTVTVESKM